MYVSGL